MVNTFRGVRKSPLNARYWFISGGGNFMCVCLYQKSVCVRNTEPKARISVFVQSRRVHLFIVKCLLENKFYIHVIYYLHICQHYKPNFHAKNIIWLQFTINYSLFKLNYNWRHYYAISLTVVMLCVCTKRVCMCNTELVCKAVRLAFSYQTSAIALPFNPWFIPYWLDDKCFSIWALFNLKGTTTGKFAYGSLCNVDKLIQGKLD